MLFKFLDQGKWRVFKSSYEACNDYINELETYSNKISQFVKYMTIKSLLLFHDAETFTKNNCNYESGYR